MKSFQKHLVVAGLLACIGMAATAQTRAPAGPAAPEMSAHRGGPGMGMMDPAQRLQMRQLRMERRLAGLKLKLNISASQEPAFNAWAAAVKPTARPQRPDRAELERMTTPERIDRMRTLRATRTATMDRRMEATKVFYGALNADQKKVFDGEGLQMLRGGRGGKGGPGGRHGRHHG